MATPSTGRVTTSVTLENSEALDCGVCYSPLRPPIFQCVVGHVLCSACHDRMSSAETCHVCRTPMTGGYRRNHDMEKLVECILVPCPNAAFGCAVKPVYYDQQAHLDKCLHAPCHCPATGCSFLGSTADLTDHFSTVHQWPSSNVFASESDMTECILLDGFNVLDVIDGHRNHLILLRVSREPVGRAIAVIYVCPRLCKDVALCKISVELTCFDGDGDGLQVHLQGSEFRLAPTDLSNGLPNSVQLIVPKYALPDTEETIEVTASITILSDITTATDLSLISLQQ